MLSESPQTDINPFQQVDDMSGALTFLAGCQGIKLWGFDPGAVVDMIATTPDPRARYVVTVCPGTKTTCNIRLISYWLTGVVLSAPLPGPGIRRSGLQSDSGMVSYLCKDDY